MRIAYVTETWLPFTDGIITRLLASIAELRRAGHEVMVIAPRGEGMTVDGVTVRGVPTVGWRFLYDGKRWGLPLLRVGRYLREFDPDVVHVVNPVMLGIAGVLSARRQGRTLVASYHTDIAAYAGCYRLGWMQPTIWALLRRLHGWAKINLATSAAACAQLAAHGIKGVRLWPRGVDLNRFRPGPARFDGRPVALYVGRLAAEKGLHRLAPLAEPDSKFDLMFVGDGPARLELQRELPAEFTGFLHGDDLAAAYREADVFVFPSTTDTLGLVILEALASGLPVVAADSPASRELLATCPAARLYPPDEPEQVVPLAMELLEDREAKVRIAREHAEKWSWNAATGWLVDIYTEAMADSADADSGSSGERAA